MKKIKVLHFELDANLGGIESFLYNVYKNNNNTSVEMDFVSRTNNPANGKVLETMGAKIIQIPSYRNFLSYCKAVNRCIKRYDIIHIHKNSAIIILPFIIAKYNRKKIICHSHNTAPSVSKKFSWLHFLNRKVLYYFVDCRLACSDLAGKWMYGDKNYIVIRNGIDTSSYKYSEAVKEKKRNELNLSMDCFVIGHIGRFTKQKNHKRLIEIYEEVFKKNQNTALLLCGMGNLKDKIKEMIQGKEYQNKIMFLGNRRDVPELLMSMDAFLMPSLYEGFPIAAIEAQAAGNDVYISDKITKEIQVCDAVSWFSLDENNRIIADKIICKKTIDKLRLERNREVETAGYDIKNTVKQLSDIYCKLYNNDILSC